MMRLRSAGLALLPVLFAAGCDLDDDDEPFDPSDPLRPPTEVGLREIASGFTHPVFVTTAPGAPERLYIVDQSGLIYVMDGEDDTPAVWLDFTDEIVELMPAFDERGLIGLAFHPDFDDNGRLFVYYSAPLRPGAPAGWDHTATISELRLGTNGLPDESTERVLLAVDEPQFNHDGGTLLFGPDGMLYISLGDGGNKNDIGVGHVPGGNAQDPTSLLGSILRIDVDGALPYAIPDGNPFADGVDGRPEIFAWGFRNPYRMSFDGLRLFVADAGQDRYEEVSLVEAGDNAGWPVYEGTHCFDQDDELASPTTCATTDRFGDAFVMPIIEYGQPATDATPSFLLDPDIGGIVVIGGHVYRGPAWANLRGRYVFGDFSYTFDAPQGRLFVSSLLDDGTWRTTPLDVDGSTTDHLGAYLLGVSEGIDEELYVLTATDLGPSGATGKVWRVVPPGEGGGATDDGPSPGPGDGTPY